MNLPRDSKGLIDKTPTTNSMSEDEKLLVMCEVVRRKVTICSSKYTTFLFTQLRHPEMYLGYFRLMKSAMSPHRTSKLLFY